jgi:hypothetical protein
MRSSRRIDCQEILPIDPGKKTEVGKMKLEGKLNFKKEASSVNFWYSEGESAKTQTSYWGTSGARSNSTSTVM